ncbi:MAG: polysaccharide pyruvyl transferase family protein [Pirellulales bacterium]|nr:polysaccharide pyruvyl transferase family protein [Pirellulales bacterium]
MRLIWHKDWRGNFGDELSPRFFAAICPGYEHITSYDRLFGIGTLLNESSGRLGRDIVFGSGYGQGSPPPIDRDSTLVLGVRGPRTAAALGLDIEHAVIGDPALFLPHLPEFLRGEPLSDAPVVFALHHRAAELWNFSSFNSPDVFFLDPGGASIENYVATIRNAKLVLADSMHAAITAASFQVPFVRVSFYKRTDDTKWADFLESLSLPLVRPEAIPAPIEPAGRKQWLRVAARLSWVPYPRRNSKASVSLVRQAEVRDAIKALAARTVGLVVADRRLNMLQDRIYTAITKIRTLALYQTTHKRR